MTNHTRACSACGDTFTSVRSDATVCSAKCGRRLRKARSMGASRPTSQTCQGCGVDLSHRHGNARYCQDCYKTREEQHAANRARSATCPHCGQTFMAKTGREKYCTLRCSGLAARARQLAIRMHRTCTACGIAFTATDTR